jgi:hypothetical protein
MKEYIYMYIYIYVYIYMYIYMYIYIYFGSLGLYGKPQSTQLHVVQPNHLPTQHGPHPSPSVTSHLCHVGPTGG